MKLRFVLQRESAARGWDVPELCLILAVTTLLNRVRAAPPVAVRAMPRMPWRSARWRLLAVAAHPASARVCAWSAIAVRAARWIFAVPSLATDFTLRASSTKLRIGAGACIAIGVTISCAHAVAGAIARARRSVGICDARMGLRFRSPDDDRDGAADGDAAYDTLHERAASKSGGPHGQSPWLAKMQLLLLLAAGQVGLGHQRRGPLSPIADIQGALCRPFSIAFLPVSVISERI